MPTRRPPTVRTRDQLVNFSAGTDEGKERMIDELARVTVDHGTRIGESETRLTTAEAGIDALESELDSLILTGPVPSARLINTTAPLSGGGDLSADRTLSLLDNGITDAKLRDSSALSVIGRSANSSGDPADIAASGNGDVMRVASGVLGFGAIPESSVTGLVADLAARVPVTRTITTTAPIRIDGVGSADLSADRTLSLAANGITDALFRQGVALSVVGVTGNSLANVADIAAGSDGDVLRRSGTTLGFGSIPESSVTGLVADLAARPTGSGTNNTLVKWTGTSTQSDSSITDDGTTVTVPIRTNFTLASGLGMAVTANARLGSATSAAHTFNGSVTHNADGSATRTYNLTITPVAQTAQRIGQQVLLQGTMDTSGGAITNIANFSSISSAKSAGASNLINVAHLYNAASGDFNIAIQSNAGNNFFHAVSGSSAFGITTNTTTIQAKVQIRGAGGSSAITVPANTVLFAENGSTACFGTLGSSTGGSGWYFANSTSATDAAILLTTSRSLQLHSGGTARLEVTSAGDWLLNGAAAGSNGDVIKRVSAVPAWSAPTATGTTTPGSTLLATGQYIFQYRRLTLTSTGRLTLEGTGEIYLDDFDGYTEANAQVSGQTNIGTPYSLATDTTLLPGTFAIQFRRVDLDKSRRLTLQCDSDFLITDFTQPTGRAVLQGQF